MERGRYEGLARLVTDPQVHDVEVSLVACSEVEDIPTVGSSVPFVGPVSWGGWVTKGLTESQCLRQVGQRALVELPEGRTATAFFDNEPMRLRGVGQPPFELDDPTS